MSEPKTHIGIIRVEKREYSGDNYILEMDDGYRINIYLMDFLKGRSEQDVRYAGISDQFCKNLSKKHADKVLGKLVDKRVTIHGRLSAFDGLLGKDGFVFVNSAADIKKQPKPKKPIPRCPRP